MGTNFYIAGMKCDDDMNPECHIGKRSAAGLYCWDCRLTLCKRGEALVHAGPSEGVPHLPPDQHGNRHIDLQLYLERSDRDWYTACPRCGQTKAEESLDQSSAGRELGFNRSVPAAKTGVRSCSSFNWAMPPERLESVRWIKDEYGRRMGRKKFMVMLEECPIQSFTSIGTWFC